MAPQSRQFLELDDFPGLMTNLDGASTPPAAAAVMTNLTPNRVGEMTSRPGYVPVTFEDE